MNRIVYIAAVIFIVLVAFYWLVLSAIGADVSSVTVHFGDGTSQRFVPESTTHPTPPPVDPPLSPPAGSTSFASGSQTILAATVSAKSDKWVYTASKPDGSIVPATIRMQSPAGRNLDAVYVGNGVRNATARDLIIENDTRYGRAVNTDRSIGAKVLNVRQNGVGVALEFTGATGTFADMVVAAGRSDQYGIKAFGAEFTPTRLNRDCTLARFISIFASSNDGHSMRIGHTRNLQLGHSNLRLPDDPKFPEAKGWAGYSRASGWVAACSINAKDVVGARLLWCRFDGPAAFNAGLPEDQPAHREWRIAGLEIDHCEFNVVRYLTLGSGVVDAKITDTVIRAVADPVNGIYDTTKLKGACLNLDGQRGAWPASGGTFTRCTFYGERLVDAGDGPNLANWQFVDCVFIGIDGVRRPIGATGGSNP